MRSIILSFVLSLSFFSSTGQELTPVKWSMDIKSLNGDEYELTWTAAIDKGWTVYSQFTSDDGPVPTEITFESEGFEKLGKASEAGHMKDGFDKIFEVDVIKFLDDENFVIKQKIKATPETTNITGYLTYMTCDDKRCLPPTDVDFNFTLPASSSAKAPTEKKVEKVKEPVVDKIQKPSIPSKVVEAAGTITQAASTNIQEGKTAVAEKVESSIDKVENTFAKAEEKLQSVSATSSPENEQESVLDLSGDDIMEPVKWSFKLMDLGDGEYDLVYQADIDNTWNVYSQFTSDDGPVPTSVNYEIQEGVELIGEAKEDGKRKEGPDALFDGVNVIKFLSDQPFTITQRIKANKQSKLKGYLTYMTCDDSQCLPPTDVDFEVNFKTKNFGLLGTVGVGGAGNPMAAGINVVGNTVNQKIPTITASYKDPVTDCGGEEQADTSIFRSFILGFLGGLIALLTPCVFPMIPLTVSYFTKDTHRSGLANGLIYGASIVVIYVAMGLILTAVFGEEALNALSTNWIANTLFFLIFIFFAFSFFGYYEITLPSSWTTKTDSIADKGGLIGIFFMAFTLALVSFSCTGPIIGSAIVSAASSAVGPAVVMLGFSLALALPFGFFAAFPSWLNSLPKSGGWMNSVKVILGFLELAFAFKFLSVADLTSHWGILKYELFLGVWVIIAALMALYLFGKIKFPHDSPVKKLSIPRMALAIGATVLTVYLATGFKVDPKNPCAYMPKAITSGIAPSANYNFFLPDCELDQDIKKKYASYTLCANGIPCFKDYYEGLSYAREIESPVFLDFTGFGCVNCRKTEEFIWVDDKVRSTLMNDFVLISLYVDDRKKLKEKHVSIRKDPQGNNVKLRTVGNKWADFQIVNFQQNSQPLYVMMTNQEQVVSNPRGYREGIEGYNSYLDCGLEAIASLK